MSDAQLVVIVGPSGVGKTTLTQILQERNDWPIAVSHTSRPPRDGEVDGVDYHFVPKHHIQAAIEDGSVVEWAEYKGNLYCLTADELERDEITTVVVERAGLDHLLDRYGHEGVLSVLVLPPSLHDLRKRLRGRGDDPELIEKRMKTAVEECALDREFALLVVNGDEYEAASRIAGVAEWKYEPCF